MALIDKDQLKVEIERRIEEYNIQSLRGAELSDLLAFLDTLPEQQEVDLEKVYDSYCKVCGHYHHTTPDFICRQACDYFKDFKALLNARKEEQL